MVKSRSPIREGHLNVFLVAGEASGDAYGAQLIRELKHECTLRGITLQTVGWGGDAMAGEGMRLLTHIRDVSFMGLWEVLKHAPTILGNLRRAKGEVARENPDVVITIDFPGFNMRLAKALRKSGHAALRMQWVAPQVWAWKAGRVKQLARDFDVVCPILPFEHETLTKAGVRIWDEGHPLLGVTFGQTHDLLRRARFAWVASGTATLEAALLHTPHALVYRTSALTYFLAKQLVKVKFIGLPNLLLNREVVPELIQDALHSKSLLEQTTHDNSTQQSAFNEIRDLLGGAGASKRVAQQIVSCFHPRN